jgi:hypothetical protein
LKEYVKANKHSVFAPVERGRKSQCGNRLLGSAGWGLIPGNESGEVAQQMEQKPKPHGWECCTVSSWDRRGEDWGKEKISGQGLPRYDMYIFILKDRAIPGGVLCREHAGDGRFVRSIANS